MDIGLDQRKDDLIGSPEAGEPLEAAEGWSWVEALDWAGRVVRRTIPPGGIAGSNPAPATNFRA